MRIGSLFSGAGGLDMAVESVFDAEIAWHCEIDQAASKVLAARWPGVPNLGDITATDWSAVKPVDILCGGWPCQPFSLAGKRKGADDERALWPEVARAIRLLRPRIVVLENVSAVLGPEFSRVANDLAALRYSFGWTCLRASDVGAPHRRERLFIVAYTASDTGWLIDGDGAAASDANLSHSRPDDRRSRRENAHSVARLREFRRDSDSRLSPGPAPNPSRDRRHEGWPQSAGLVGGSDAAERGNGPVELLPTPSVADGMGGHLNRSGARSGELLLPGIVRELLSTPQSRDYKGVPSDSFNQANLCRDVADATNWGKYIAAIARWEQIAGPAPSPTEPNRNGNPRLNPAFSEWMMGWPAGWVTDVDISRNDKLRIIGNGVVPQQAIAALRWLLSIEAAA